MTQIDDAHRAHIDRLVAAAPLPTKEQARALWLLLHPVQVDEPDELDES